LVFYFASQSGTAERLCKILEEEATKLGVENTKIIDFEDFKPEMITSHELVIFSIATHYEGEPPDNTKKFHKWLLEQQKMEGSNRLFKSMKYTVFGLGDTSYQYY